MSLIMKPKTLPYHQRQDDNTKGQRTPTRVSE